MTEPRPYLNQGDPRWARVKAGLSYRATIGQVGCVLTCIAQAARHFGIDSESTPANVQHAAIAAWDGANPQTAPFQPRTAAAFSPRIGRIVGLRIDDRVNVIEGPRFYSALSHTFASGGVVMMHVDSKDDGSDEPNHWVLGLRLEGVAETAAVIYADPDGGHEGRLPLGALKAPSPKGKPYELRGIRPVFAARPHG